MEVACSAAVRQRGRAAARGKPAQVRMIARRQHARLLRRANSLPGEAGAHALCFRICARRHRRARCSAARAAPLYAAGDDVCPPITCQPAC